MTEEVKSVLKIFKEAKSYEASPEVVEKKIIGLIPDEEMRNNTIKLVSTAISIYNSVKENIVTDLDEFIDNDDTDGSIYEDNDKNSYMKKYQSEIEDILVKLFNEDNKMVCEYCLFSINNNYYIYHGNLECDMPCAEGNIIVNGVFNSFSEEELELMRNNFQLFKQLRSLGIPFTEKTYQYEQKDIADITEDDFILLQASKLIGGMEVNQTEEVDKCAKKLQEYLYGGASDLFSDLICKLDCDYNCNVSILFDYDTLDDAMSHQLDSVIENLGYRSFSRYGIDILASKY